MIFEEQLIENYINTSNIPCRYLGDITLQPTTGDLPNFKRLQNITQNVREFVEEGTSILLYSNITGNGKTSWACAIGKAYIELYACRYDIECPVLFLNVAEFLNKKKSAITDQTLLREVHELEDNISKAHIVIWDDLAVKGLSEYDSEQLYTYINYRTSNMKTNIFTANYKPDQLEVILGPRIYSRVVNSSLLIELTGSDRRGVSSKF